MVWSLPDLALVRDLELAVSSAFAWDAARDALLVGGSRGELFTVDLSTGEVLDERAVSSGPDLRSLAVSTHADALAITDGTRLYRARVRAGRLEASPSVTGAWCACFSPDSARLAVGGGDTRLSLRDLRDRELLVLDDAPKPLSEVAFAAGGERLLALSHLPGSPTYVAVWDAPARVELGD